MTVQNITCEAVITAPAATVITAAKLMRAHDVRAIFVIESPGKDACALIGAVTDRDLVVEVMAIGLDASVITVGDLIKNGLTEEQHQKRSRALIETMRANGVTAVPMVEDGEVTGSLTIEQLIQIVRA